MRAARRGCAVLTGYCPVWRPAGELASPAPVKKLFRVQKKGHLCGQRARNRWANRPTAARRRYRSAWGALLPSPRSGGGVFPGWPESHGLARSCAAPARCLRRLPHVRWPPPPFRPPGEPFRWRHAAGGPPESGSGHSTRLARPAIRTSRLPGLRPLQPPARYRPGAWAKLAMAVQPEQPRWGQFPTAAESAFQPPRRVAARDCA